MILRISLILYARESVLLFLCLFSIEDSDFHVIINPMSNLYHIKEANILFTRCHFVSFIIFLFGAFYPVAGIEFSFGFLMRFRFSVSRMKICVLNACFVSVGHRRNRASRIQP